LAWMLRHGGDLQLGPQAGGYVRFGPLGCPGGANRPDARHLPETPASVKVS
jgi:hypothetical protein